MSPICLPCKQEMEPKRNDTAVRHEGTIWYGDLWQCPRCQGQIITGFGQGIELHVNDEAIEVRRRT